MQMPYVAQNLDKLSTIPSIGTGECAVLVQYATGAPLTKMWYRGPQVITQKNLPTGTAIATFDGFHYPTGDSPKHAALFASFEQTGIKVVDQWNNYDKNGALISKQPPHYRILWYNHPTYKIVNRAESFYVIL